MLTTASATAARRRPLVHAHGARRDGLRRRRTASTSRGRSTCRAARRPRPSSWTVELRDPSLVVRAASGAARWDVRRAMPRAPRSARSTLARVGAGRPRRAAAESPRAPGRRVLRRGRALVPHTLRARLAVGRAARAAGRRRGSRHPPCACSRGCRATAIRRGDPRSSPARSCTSCAASPLEMPGEGIVLPPVYYGTVDATPLWVCLLADAWRAGMPDAEVRELLPALRRALDWLLRPRRQRRRRLPRLHRRDRARPREPGLEGLRRLDPVARRRTRRGTDRAVRSAGLRLRGGARGRRPAGRTSARPGGDDLREWAAALKARFAERVLGRPRPRAAIPASRSTRDKRPVDTLTSNIGHLLGTGILDPDEEAEVARPARRAARCRRASASGRCRRMPPATGR